MAEIDQVSDTSSDLNWPIDHPLEGQQHDRVVFENVADQYVKGEDVLAFFTIVQDIKVNPDEDQIGLLRVGCTNIKDCLAYASVQFAPSTSSGSVRHGTATFPSASLPATDDEFYQFCYIVNKTKNLGSSIPFQLNCSSDDINLLHPTTYDFKTKSGGLIALDGDGDDDIVVIHTKNMLTEEKLRQENRQLLDINRRLESQKDEFKAKLEVIELKQKEHMAKLNQETQTLINIHKTSLVELSTCQQTEAKLRAELDEYRKLSEQHQNEAIQNADRCRTLEVAQEHIFNDTNQIRSQLAVTSQLTKDQATQIIDLERRLMQANELTKAADQRTTVLEQQIRDLRLTSEKYQISSQGQIQEYTRKIAQLDDQIKALEETNHLLKEELNTVKVEKDNRLKELQQQLEQTGKENDELKGELEKVRIQTNENSVDQQAYLALKTSYTEVEKRCVKHQKGAVDAKKQLAVYQNFINDLQRENQDLTERLAAGAEAYKTLFRKYTLLDRSINQPQQQQEIEQPAPVDDEQNVVQILCNTAAAKPQESPRTSSVRSSMAHIDDEVSQCPMCYWQFPPHLTVDGKREHIEHHFQ